MNANRMNFSEEIKMWSFVLLYFMLKKTSVSITKLKKKVEPIHTTIGYAEQYLSEYSNNMQTIIKKATHKCSPSKHFTELNEN